MVCGKSSRSNKDKINDKLLTAYSRYIKTKGNAEQQPLLKHFGKFLTATLER